MSSSILLEKNTLHISESCSVPISCVATDNIIVAPGVRCVLLQKPGLVRSFTEVQALHSTLEIGKGAFVELAILSVQGNVGNDITIHEYGTLKVRHVYLGTNNIFESSKIDLRGESAALDSEGIFIRNGGELRITTQVTNWAPRTQASVSMKGSLQGNALAYLYGNMVIKEHACESKSELSQHVLLLSKEAKADALPCLEILNNDVKAGHSASVRPIDPDQVQYLCTRGLSKQEAEDLIAKGFVTPSLEGMSLTAQEAVSHFLKEQISKTTEESV